MAIPSAAELNIYDRATHTAEARVALALGPRMWTGAMDEQFNTPLDPTEFWFTQYGGNGPLVESGTLKFQLFGGSLRQQVVTRKHWFPEDPTLAFKVTISAIFNTLDPVYQATITVGGLEQAFGIEHECMRVIQRGSAFTTGGVGNIFIDGAGSIETISSSRANDQSAHSYVVEWDPDAPGGAGTEKLTIRFDGAIVHESSAAGVAVQPRYISLGMVQSTRAGAVTPGFPGVPYAIMLINNIRVEQDGDGYESFVNPTWTTPDLGNDIDTAADGERFTQDGQVWAKIPQDAVDSLEVRGGRDHLSDSGTIALKPADPSDPVTTPNRFLNDRWVNRTVSIDTRLIDDDGSATSWKRQIVAIIDTDQTTMSGIELELRDRPMARLDSFISRSYLNIDGDADQQGEIEGTNIGFFLAQILEDLVEVAEIVAGDLLGATSTDILAPPVLPRALSTGGQSLLPTFLEWCDRMVLECWRRYRTTGAERYGEIRVNLWSFGEGNPVYSFAGRGATDGFQNVNDATLLETKKDGTGQAFYRQNHPSFGSPILSLEFLPVVGQFPTAAYPPEARVLNDSLAYLESTALSVLMPWPKADEVNEVGGVARHRFRRENVMRRRLELKVGGHDWIEPTDEIAFDDPGWTGAS